MSTRYTVYGWDPQVPGDDETRPVLLRTDDRATALDAAGDTGVHGAGVGYVWDNAEGCAVTRTDR